jgi:tetratricopeptide (TPR) repeat protein
MNYGLRLMGEGDYTGAMEYYTKALEFSPSYSYLYTNIAICYHAMGQNTLAEENFAKALQFGYYSHKTHYYYGDFLLKNKRYQEAAKSFNISLEMAPRYIFSMYKLMEIHAQLENWDSLKEMVKQAQAILPSDPTATYYLQISDGKLTKLQQARKQTIDLPSANAFLELSLQFYNASKFDSCVWAAQKAVEFDSLMITAYNNMCAANNVLYRWNDAIAAGEKALQINPNNQLAKNNLAVSYHRKAMEAELKNLNTANELIELSLKFYQEQMYEYCIRACEKALKIDSKNVLAMNNICTSYNAMGDFEKAIAIGEKAVKMAPDYQLAKNNLAVARQGLAKANSK